MRRSILAILLIATHISAVVGQQASHVTRHYDRFENRTSYWTETAYVAPGLDMTATFSFKGRGAGKDVEGFWLKFSSSSPDWRFIKNSRLIFLIDGESVDLGAARATDNDVKTGYGSAQVKEILVYSVTYGVLRKIATADKVEVRLGSTEFELKSFVRSDISELLGKIKVIPTTRRKGSK